MVLAIGPHFQGYGNPWFSVHQQGRSPPFSNPLRTNVDQLRKPHRLEKLIVDEEPDHAGRIQNDKEGDDFGSQLAGPALRSAWARRNLGGDRITVAGSVGHCLSKPFLQDQ